MLNNVFCPICCIVPVYNTNSLVLKRCFDAILSNNHKLFVLLIVDDGSTSNDTLNVLSDYAKLKSVILLKKKNGGVSSARNYGIHYNKNNLKCKYVTFIDSDDVVSHNFFSIMMNCAVKTGCSIVVTKTTVFFDEKDINIVLNQVSNDDGFLLCDNETGLMNLCRFTYSSLVMGKLFNASLLDKVLFDERLKTGEDVKFLYSIFSLCLTSCFINIASYALNREPKLTSLSRNVLMDNRRVLDGLFSNLTVLQLSKKYKEKQVGQLLNDVAADAFLELYPRITKKHKYEDYVNYKKYIGLYNKCKCIKYYKPQDIKGLLKKTIYLYFRPLYKPLYKLYILIKPGKYDKKRRTT